MKQRVASGLLRGCPEPECREGKIELETPGRFSTVLCPTCNGKKCVVVWRCLDLTKLKGRVAA